MQYKMGRALNLLRGEFVDRGRIARSSAKIRRGTRISGAEVLIQEPERIEGYIDEDYLDNIIDLKTSLEAVNSLKTSPRRGDTTDFVNLLRGAGKTGKDSFAEHLFEKYGKSRLEIIRESRLVLKSKRERSGFKINSKIYLIPVKIKTREFVQARRFKDGRVAKLEKRYINQVGK